MPPRPASLADGLGSIAGLAPNPPGDNPRRSRRSSHLNSKKVNLVIKNGTHTPDVHTVDTVSASKAASPKAVSAKGDNRSKDQANDASKDTEMSSVPDPVPAGDAAPVHTSPLFVPKATGNAALTGSNTVPAPVTATHQFFTPLPAYYSMAASTSSRDASISLASLRSASAAAASSYSPIPTKPAVNVQQTKPQQSISHRMSTTIIVLLALGGVCVLGAILVVVKLRRHPKKRWPPTPSLPILQDQDYPKEKAAGGGANGKGDESPIFGGKERFSSRPGSNAVLWNWTQYQSGIPKPPPVAKGGDARASVIDVQRRYSRIDDATTAKIQQATSATYVQPQIVQNTAPRTPSRLSTVSLYPGTNYPQSNEHIGIAVSELPGTKAGADPSATAGKSSAQDFGRRRSVRRSMRDLRDLERRRTTLYDGSDSLAYVEADMSSPSILPVAQGRERIKAPYGAGSYLRTSTSASAINHASAATDSNPFEEPAYAVPPMPYAHSNEARRDRNTKTLTSAAGLASPAPPSPGPTLYPDDSLSVVGDRRHVASQKKHLVQTKLGSPGTEATALGNMMLSDYRTSKHGGPVTDARAHGGTPDDVLSALDSPDDFAPLRMHRRADDKPPRVPSPPPLPSLAQMAMAHTNPDDFADYRSPTYSIYGLYDPDRKSRATDGGY